MDNASEGKQVGEILPINVFELKICVVTGTALEYVSTGHRMDLNQSGGGELQGCSTERKCLTQEDAVTQLKIVNNYLIR